MASGQSEQANANAGKFHDDGDMNMTAGAATTDATYETGNLAPPAGLQRPCWTGLAYLHDL